MQASYFPSRWSPFYPFNYPRNVICNFTFKYTLIKNYYVAACLYNIDIQDSKSCEEGSLSVYDGKNGRPYLMDKFCGVETPRAYVAQGDTLTIQLKATNSSSRGGFQANLYAFNTCRFLFNRMIHF